jgi:hypothetical protein
VDEAREQEEVQEYHRVKLALFEGVRIFSDSIRHENLQKLIENTETEQGLFARDV